MKGVIRNDQEAIKAYYTHMPFGDIVYDSATLPHCIIGELHNKEDIEWYPATDGGVRENLQGIEAFQTIILTDI